MTEVPDPRDIELVEVTPFGPDELLSRLRETRLRGHEGVRPFRDAQLATVRGLDPELLSPAQNYVLSPTVHTVLRLRQALLGWGLDLFDLTGGANVRTSADPGALIPIIPPIIEESHEPDGHTALLISDGQHRVYAARSIGLPIAAVVAREVPAEYPYYAHPLPGGWDEVIELDALPTEHQKKHYRQPTGYKALFREYNEVFPGVQQQRARSNPRHLEAGH